MNAKNKPTHTPGPWTLTVNSHRDGTRYAAARDACIRGSNGDYVMSMQGRMDDERGNADLRLIAAAPNLLAALVALLVENENHAYSKAKTAAMWPAIQLARAAVAEATRQEGE